MIFEALDLIADESPREAAVNMAADEILLRNLKQPVLRAYRWARPAVSFGYFAKFTEVHSHFPERDPVRRWTGGGVVAHGEDFTYSLIVPPSEPIARVRPAESYRLIHEALADCLRACGIPAAVAKEAAILDTPLCFQKPVCFDLLLGGRKIGGAAQRRTRFGLLHQGSIQVCGLPEGFAGRVAVTFSQSVVRSESSENWLHAAEELARERYASEAWLRKF